MLHSSFDKAAAYAALAAARARQNDITSGIHDAALESNNVEGPALWLIAWLETNAKVAKAAALKVEELSKNEELIDQARDSAELAEFYVEMATFENSIRQS